MPPSFEAPFDESSQNKRLRHEAFWGLAERYLDGMGEGFRPKWPPFQRKASLMFEQQMRMQTLVVGWSTSHTRLLFRQCAAVGLFCPVARWSRDVRQKRDAALLGETEYPLPAIHVSGRGWIGFCQARNRPYRLGFPCFTPIPSVRSPLPVATPYRLPLPASRKIF